MRLLLICTLTLLISFSVPSSALTFESAKQLYASGSSEQAFNAFAELAKLGNADAMHKMGLIRVQSQGVPSDAELIEGYAWFLLALDAGFNDDSMANSLTQLLNRVQVRAAYKQLRQLKKEYDISAIQDKYFPIAINSKSGGKLYSPARLIRSSGDWDKKDKYTGFVDISHTVHTDGTTRDHMVLYSTSRHLEKQALEQIKHYIYQPPEYKGRLMTEYFRKTRISFSKNVEELKALEWERYTALLTEAERGNSNAMQQLADHIMLTPTLNKSSTIWQVKAAQYGSAQAKFELGRNLLYGNQCLFDYDKSLFWLTNAANGGSVEAQMLLGIEHLTGYRLPKDLSVGLLLLYNASNNGLDAAKLRYAHILAIHPDRDLRKIEKPYRYIEAVDKRRYSDLITFYETVSLIESARSDVDEAVKWQEKAIKEAKKYQLPIDNFVAALLHMQNKNLIVSD